MKIEGDTVFFKSILKNYLKEERGDKPYTIQRIQLWSELKEWEQFYNRWQAFGQDAGLEITITSTGIGRDTFTRKISDIHEHEGQYIIAWKV